jgi:hypothetical protein
MMYGYGAAFGLGGWLGMLGMVIAVIGVVLLIAWLVGCTSTGADAASSMRSDAGCSIELCLAGHQEPPQRA